MNNKNNLINNFSLSDLICFMEGEQVLNNTGQGQLFKMNCFSFLFK